MTDREKAIVMAHTGICMLAGEKFSIFHEYVEKILDRPVWTHELPALESQIKEKSKPDFLKLCEAEEIQKGPLRDDEIERIYKQGIMDCLNGIAADLEETLFGKERDETEP